jgi:hypothetical protein
VENTKTEYPENQSPSRKKGCCQTCNYFKNTEVEDLSKCELTCIYKRQAVKYQKAGNYQLYLVLDQENNSKDTTGSQGNKEVY